MYKNLFKNFNFKEKNYKTSNFKKTKICTKIITEKQMLLPKNTHQEYLAHYVF